MERSYLFVPGNKPERINKALDSKADAVIIDLEDAVAVDAKTEARQQVEEQLKGLGPVSKSLFLRINDINTPFWKEDMKLVKDFSLTGVMMPKAQSSEEVCEIANELTEEQVIIPLIETAKGVSAAFNIAGSSNKVTRIAFGAVDYCLDLGISISENQNELQYPRSVITVASRAANIEPPIDTVFVDISDDEGLKKETKRAKQLGMFSKLCIHPRQVGMVNELFSPSLKEQRWAKKVITSFEKAENEGVAAIQVDGIMIDYPVYKQAIAIVQRSANN
ncbi:CoA ester lyase [Alteribacillus sp. JSM 102045]|uniref:HpcH/HpaI aldolase/citrate lyase family protein n=1 Tax=Alteribacillus sp. JSM 102045 TaxID=1562101 RepID=UPI0035C0150E